MLWEVRATVVGNPVVAISQDAPQEDLTPPDSIARINLERSGI
jgi:hypothetical protein